MGITTKDLPEAVVDAAYERADKLLREAVEVSASKEQFLHNLAHCQIMATRVLALLVFNTYQQDNLRDELNGKCIWDYFTVMVDGLRKELTYVMNQHEVGSMEEVRIKEQVQN